MHTGTLRLTTTGHQGQEVPYEVPYLAFPTTTGRILIHAPGTGEKHEGRRNRYISLGGHLAEIGLASLVSFKPPFPDAEFKYPPEPYSYRDASWNRIYIQTMGRMVVHCLQNAEAICGSKDPEVFLSGFSTGASVAMAVAPLFPKVRRVLLISAYDSVGDYFYQGLAAFQGEIYATCGELDTTAVVLAEALEAVTRRAKAVHVCIVPDFNHGFSTPADGGRTLSKAFSWAFAGDDTFPSPEGGLPLDFLGDAPLPG